MKGSREGDNLNAFRLAFFEPIFARHFNRKLAAFGARIREKHRIGETLRHKLIRQRLLLGDHI